MRRPAHDTAGKRRREQFGIIGFVDEKSRRSLAGCEFVECGGQLLAVGAGQGCLGTTVARQCGENFAMARGNSAERNVVPRRVLPGPEGVAKARDQVRGCGKFALRQILTWVGRMQLVVGCPEGCQCVRQAACTRTRPRAAQDCTLESVTAPCSPYCSMGVLEQGQERYRWSTVERGRGGEAGKNSRRRVGERVAAESPR